MKQSLGNIHVARHARVGTVLTTKNRPDSRSDRQGVLSSASSARRASVTQQSI
ncbi:hypothetical protein [Burkholderia stabilis]|uniref:hypothetical protein n=1 Tax=Burkholderia stabilis TaxID=95485 RepID=UPI0012E9E454|nr:hypothetical protein [Burkholderia stabilis]HDR9490087.1 hypothetical protein [Burkholderia stabilis]HDR9521641.1 hypothetical protein [Burkholderia stabilis]HDR9537192.1 hypothetical protein [Burkholderia stabilis]HDR9575138.1 hypothetical protein [Burkholderia stabilis]HDR9583474.1 hypothetical protein [Burkholderia stabilis]